MHHRFSLISILMFVVISGCTHSPPGNKLPPHLTSSSLPEIRIAFGSCIKNPLSQTFRSIQSVGPHLMLFLGDTIYIKPDDLLTEGGIKEKYRLNYENGSPRRLIQAVPTFAIWDDHDFGLSDSDSTSPYKEPARNAFRAEWNNPSPPEKLKNSIAFELVLGDVLILMTDNRTYRINSTTEKEGQMFGKNQLDWIENRLLKSDFRLAIIASGNQLLMTGSRFLPLPNGRDTVHIESLLDFPTERARFFSILAAALPKVLIISGDRHFAEFLTLEKDGHTFLEVTSSPLSARLAERIPIPHSPNTNGHYVATTNFGVITIDRTASPISVLAEIRDDKGGIVLNRRY